eukprot:COSAG06_NODE_9519_length_1880_cov_3.705222_2_plen_254_part_00
MSSHSPVAAFHTRTVLSTLADTIFAQSGLKHAEHTQLLCPLSVSTHWPSGGTPSLTLAVGFELPAGLLPQMPIAALLAPRRIATRRSSLLPLRSCPATCAHTPRAPPSGTNAAAPNVAAAPRVSRYRAREKATRSRSILETLLGTDVDAGTPSIPVDAPQDEEPRLIAGELHAELTKHLQDAFKITSLACVPMTRADIDQRGAPAMGDPAALAAAIATALPLRDPDADTGFHMDAAHAMQKQLPAARIAECLT